MTRTRLAPICALIASLSCGGGGGGGGDGPALPGAPGSASIRVDAARPDGLVPRELWGSQILWTGPSNGLPARVSTTQEADAAFAKLMSYASLVAELGPTVLRYPGGLLANHHDWRDGIGPAEERRTVSSDGRNVVVGTDEFLRLCEAVGAEAMITLNWALGPALAADWVEYVNAPNDGSNPRGGIDWAAERAANGHPEPYGVRFWEVGNELRGDDFFQRLYGTSLRTFAAEMRRVDPDVVIGAIGHGTFFQPDYARGFYANVNEYGGDAFDFWSKHLYSPSALGPNAGFELTKPGATVEDVLDFPTGGSWTFDFSLFNADESAPSVRFELLVDGEVVATHDVGRSARAEERSFTVSVAAGSRRIGVRLAGEGILRLYHEVPVRAPFRPSLSVDFKNDRQLYDNIQAGFLTRERFLFEPAGTLGDHDIYATENNTVYNFEEAPIRHVDLREALNFADLFHVMIRNGIPLATTFLLFEEDRGLGQIEGVALDRVTGEIGRSDPRRRPTFLVQKLYRDALDEGERLPVRVTSPTFRVGFETGVAMGMVSRVLTEAGRVQAVAGRSFDGRRVTVMAINKHRDQPIEVEVVLDGFTPTSAEHRFVTGPSVAANNEPESGAEQVALVSQPLPGAASRMRVTLPARSANALIFRN